MRGFRSGRGVSRRIAPALALTFALAAAARGAEAPAGTPSYQPDWNHIADLMVTRDLRLAAGERVLIHYDPGRDPELVAALRTAIIRAGGRISAELTWPSKATVAYLATLPPAEARRRAEAEDAVYRDLFAHADVYLWLHLPTSPDAVPKRFEQLIAHSRVRAIHSHWFESPDPAEHERVYRMYERAIAVEPADLRRTLERLEARLRGTDVHITSPAGTDLHLRIPATAWFHRNTGEASRAKVATARSVRDREEELPAGVLRTTDVTGTVGTLVASWPFSDSSGAVRIAFSDGRAAEVRALGPAGEEFAADYAKEAGDRDRVSELVIGTNPELVPILPSGFLPYYGYGAGIIRVAMGDNWESGGRLRTPGHAEEWLFITDGTLTANGVTLIDHGRLVVPPAE